MAPDRSLSRLLAVERGVFHAVDHPSLTEQKILAWPDAYHSGTGPWPTRDSGMLPGIDGINWCSVDSAFRHRPSGLRPGVVVVCLP